MANVEVREIGKDDWRDAWEVISKCSEWLSEQGMDHWKDYYTEEKVQEKFGHSKIFVLYVDDKPVGTGSYSTEAPEYYSEQDINCFENPKAVAAYFSALCVDPEFQGKGYGKLLVKSREDALAKDPDIEAYRFDARASYRELIKFHLKNGFKIVGVMDDEGEDYFLFEKVIK